MNLRGTSRGLWAIALPLIFAGLSESVVDVTDTIFLAYYGVTELGAIAFADSFYEVAMVVLIGLAEGLQIVVSRRAGQGDIHGIGRTLQHGLLLLGGCALVVFALLRFASPLLIGVLVDSPSVGEAVESFLRIAAFNVLFDAANLAFVAFYVGIARTGVLVSATIILALTNLTLDYVLIFGKLGLPDLGIEGAAIASVTAEVAAFVFFVLYTWRRGYMARFGLLRWSGWSRALARRLTGLSSPVALDTLVGAVQWFVIFLLVERLGEVALAASSIVFTSYVVLKIPLDGLSEATATTVGNLIGQGRVHRVVHLLRVAVVQGCLLVVPVAFLTLLVPEAVLWVFAFADQDTAGAAASVRVVGAALLVAVPAEMCMATLVGSGDTRATFLIEFAVMTLVVAQTWLAVSVLEWPLAMVWSCVVVAWILRLVLAVIHLRRGSWRLIEV